MGKQAGKGTDEYKSVFGSRNRSTGSSKGNADWGSVDPSTILELIGKVTSRGGAIRFGYTRDGGAYALGLYYGAESKTVYCRPGEDLDAFIAEWQEFYENLPYSGGVSPDDGQKRP